MQYQLMQYSQMEVDLVDSCIGRKQKKQKDQVIQHFLTTILWRDSGTIKPSKTISDIKVTDIKAINYSPDGVIQVILNIDLFNLSCRMKKMVSNENYPKMYEKKIESRRNGRIYKN